MNVTHVRPIIMGEMAMTPASPPCEGTSTVDCVAWSCIRRSVGTRAYLARKQITAPNSATPSISAAAISMLI